MSESGPARSSDAGRWARSGLGCLASGEIATAFRSISSTSIIARNHETSHRRSQSQKRTVSGREGLIWIKKCRR